MIIAETLCNKRKRYKMAKAASKEVKTTTAEEFKYGVNDLADALDIEAASVRVKLRSAGIEKAGRSYGWNSQKEFDRVVKELKAVKSAPREKAETTKAPAKKTAAAGRGRKPAATAAPAKKSAKPARGRRAAEEASA